ncbi:ribonuclease Z [Geomesophilobacter sediminis]|uniref:MBL fold metallo-hydrolase n=1 Tax=Geomesophilobacter sediminis TaxID=2798584 RepID=A0A8J7JFX8_9BACT|nr:MBL fold metallo-hydrolase [Geomesophilobacter sediminis]MBJ6725379.1 MBL fold metallo-hydrolase [Geomesophilobacter sediminis]
MPKPFRYIEPVLYAGLFDDPLLLVYVRPLGRSILFDCGQLHHLAKRELKSLDAIFISHAHMDHFMGMDTFIRHSHVSPRTTEIFGPPGLADRLQAKLTSYDWNLADTFWGNLRVGEVHGDTVSATLFSGPEGFARRPDGESLGPIIYRNDYLNVRAVLCDHKIGVLCYRLTETEAFGLDEELLEREHLVKGPWISELERLYHANTMSGIAVRYLRRSGESIREETGRADELYARVRRETRPASIGYVTDIAFSDENLAKVEALLEGVTLLVCECAFLAADQDKARKTGHFCTSDLNLLLQRLRPTYALPMHHSKGYLGTSQNLFDELRPPAGVTILRVPDRITPRPIMACEVPRPIPLPRNLLVN